MPITEQRNNNEKKSEFDYAEYLWDGQRNEFMQPYTKVTLPKPKNRK